MISVIIPYHDMQNGAFFLKRAIDSVTSQSYEDYEIVLVKQGKMAENTNAGIKKAKGDIVKILFMDDYLAHKDALKDIAENWKSGWLVTGCEHDNGTRFNPHMPSYNDKVLFGNNTIGSPSVLAMERGNFFDENLSWLLDCELYYNLFRKYGPPKILDSVNVVIGIGAHQTTNTMSEEEKIAEYNYIYKKYA